MTAALCLPVEVVEMVQMFLCTRDIVECGRVCRKWRQASLTLLPPQYQSFTTERKTDDATTIIKKEPHKRMSVGNNNCTCGDCRNRGSMRNLDCNHIKMQRRSDKDTRQTGEAAVRVAGRQYFTDMWQTTNHVELSPPGEIIFTGHVRCRRSLLMVVKGEVDGLSDAVECYAYIKRLRREYTVQEAFPTPAQPRDGGRRGASLGMETEASLFEMDCSTGLPIASRVDLPLVFADASSELSFQGFRFLTCTTCDGTLLVFDAYSDSLLSLPINVCRFQSSSTGRRFIVEDATHFFYCDTSQHLIAPSRSAELLTSAGESLREEEEQEEVEGGSDAFSNIADAGSSLSPHSWSPPPSDGSLSLPSLSSRCRSIDRSEGGSSGRHPAEELDAPLLSPVTTSRFDASREGEDAWMDMPAPPHYLLLDEPRAWRDHHGRLVSSLDSATTPPCEPANGGDRGECVLTDVNPPQALPDADNMRRISSRTLPLHPVHGLPALPSSHSLRSPRSSGSSPPHVVSKGEELVLSLDHPLVMGSLGDSSAAWHDVWVGEHSFLYEHDSGRELFYAVPREDMLLSDHPPCRVLDASTGRAVVNVVCESEGEQFMRTRLEWVPKILFPSSTSHRTQSDNGPASLQPGGEGGQSGLSILRTLATATTHCLLGIPPLASMHNPYRLHCDEEAASPFYLSHDTTSTVAHSHSPPHFPRHWIAADGTLMKEQDEEEEGEEDHPEWGDACGCDEFVFLDSHRALVHVIRCVQPPVSQRRKGMHMHSLTAGTSSSSSTTTSSRWDANTSTTVKDASHAAILCDTHDLRHVLPHGVVAKSIQVVVPEVYRLPLSHQDAEAGAFSAGLGDPVPGRRGVWLLETESRAGATGTDSAQTSVENQRRLLFVSSDTSISRWVEVGDCYDVDSAPVVMAERGCIVFVEASSLLYARGGHGGESALDGLGVGLERDVTEYGGSSGGRVGRNATASASGCASVHSLNLGHAITSGYGSVLRFPLYKGWEEASHGSAINLNERICTRNPVSLNNLYRKASIADTEAASMQGCDVEVPVVSAAHAAAVGNSRSWCGRVASWIWRWLLLHLPSQYALMTMTTYLSCFMTAVSLVSVLGDLLTSLWGSALVYKRRKREAAHAPRHDADDTLLSGGSFSLPVCGRPVVDANSLFLLFADLLLISGEERCGDGDHMSSPSHFPTFTSGDAAASTGLLGYGNVVYSCALLLSALYLTHYIH